MEIFQSPFLYVGLSIGIILGSIVSGIIAFNVNKKDHKREMKRIANRTFVVLILVIGVSSCGNSQVPKFMGNKTVQIECPPSQKVLIADETEVVASGKTSFRIITSNDSIAHFIMRKFENNGMTKFTYTPKKDRHGRYWERTFYFKNEMWDEVANFINTKCK